MKKKNRLILIICAGLIALVALLALFIGGPARQAPEGIEASKGYIYIAAGNQEKWFMLPEEESTISLTRTDANGKEIRNEIAFTPNGVYMKASTCENQDCVHQGTVTLENKEKRALKNMILCLPNDVIIELYSAQDITAMSGN